MDINKLIERIIAAAEQDTWVPEEEYSVFTQWDKEYYCAQREKYTHKYRVFKAISSVIQPSSIVELGTHGGSGADAYLSGVDYNASYIGYDSFGIGHYKNGDEWDSADRCKLLFEARKFDRYNLIQCDLRQVDKIDSADLAIVDAEHDYRNCYQDLLLCLNSQPRYIHIDDYPGDIRFAVEDFVKNYRGNVVGYGYIPHVCGSGIIKMKYDNV